MPNIAKGYDSRQTVSYCDEGLRSSISIRHTVVYRPRNAVIYLREGSFFALMTQTIANSRKSERAPSTTLGRFHYKSTIHSSNNNCVLFENVFFFLSKTTR